LHLLQPQLSPTDEPMSYYVHGAYGWLISVGLIALGIGSSALTLGVARRAVGVRQWCGVAFLAVWSAGALLGGMFAADPPGQWDRPPSAAGAIHGVAAIIALTALPVAAILLSRSTAVDRQTRPQSSRAKVLALATVITYIAFMLSVVPVMLRPGPPVLLGLAQRLLFIAYLVWLSHVAFRIGNNKP
jgi:hypothetical protein